MHLGPSAVRLELFRFPISKYDIFLIAGQVKMQLKVRVARFSKSAASGVAITKFGMIAFSSATRADSGRDPKQDDIVYLEIPDPEGDLEPIVEAVTWACDKGALEAALVSRER